MNSIPISVQLYTLRDALEKDLAGTIQRVAEIGFAQVEPYNFVATARELGEALQANRLTAPSGHAPLLSQDQDQIFAAAKELGITTVILRRPTDGNRVAFGLLVGAVTISVVADLTFNLVSLETGGRSASVIDGAYLLCYLLLIAALVKSLSCIDVSEIAVAPFR